ncbi:MAG: galactose mutarotase [Clostridia bacterium]|nr:galactose mutarotase [Clostridia bacterium]
MSIEKYLFDKLPSGKEVTGYVMKNANGMTVDVLTYGLRIRNLLVPNKDGGLTDVILGYDSIDNYLDDYQGTFVGRYANRIGKAKFTIDGTEYQLDKNNNDNSLHGGIEGFSYIVFNVKEIIDGDEPAIVFNYLSPDGDQHFPGNLDVTVTYKLTSDNQLQFTYEGVSDKKTPFNPTNHAFFNIDKDHSETIFDTELKINASYITPVEDDLIPTGEIASVDNTPYDFRISKLLGADMFSKDHSINLCGGFDHNFCVDGEGYREHAVAYCKDTGIELSVWSDMPGVQLYTFNKPPVKMGKNGIIHAPHTSFCLETQFYPDSPNQPSFPFEFLEPGKKFISKTAYKFAVK